MKSLNQELYNLKAGNLEAKVTKRILDITIEQVNITIEQVNKQIQIAERANRFFKELRKNVS